jgi:AcrR family transcriptional regulator
MSKGAETRAAILDEAIAIASQVGFDALTIGQLAERTDMSKSGLFAHFKSKEQLQLQALDRARERFIDVVVRPALATSRGEPRARALFEGWLTWIETSLPGGCIFIAAAAEVDDRPGSLRDAVVKHEHDLMEMITTVAGTAVAEGQWRSDLDLEQFGFEMYGILLAHHHSFRLMHDARANERTRAAFESLVARSRSKSRSRSRPSSTT